MHRDWQIKQLRRDPCEGVLIRATNDSPGDPANEESANCFHVMLARSDYSNLIADVETEAFQRELDGHGTLVPREFRGRHYWYYQKKQHSLYVGADGPRIAEQIRNYNGGATASSDRRALVGALSSCLCWSQPEQEVGHTIECLARAGMFRMRAVLVGTAAFQTYALILGMRLPAASVVTKDIDIAQFKEVSSAIADFTPPILDILHGADRSFREIPNIYPNRTTAYQSANNVRVEFFAPNQGPDTDMPTRLSAFGTYAAPLRFLDYLIYDPQPTAVLHDTGVHALVPTPQKYALHKLMITQRRAGLTKRQKDILQVETLLGFLSRERPKELRLAWDDAFSRGRAWQQLLIQGLDLIEFTVRAATLRVIT